MSVRILVGDCRAMLRTLPEGSAQTCVTSPPYFGLRDYGHAGQIGLEPTPDDFIAAMVEVFREVRRVLADDGTLWLNLGDSYTGSSAGQTSRRAASKTSDKLSDDAVEALGGRIGVPDGLKPKDLMMVPARVALALQADGWWLRSHIIWHKPNPMPESVTDRPTNSHESLFLLAKSQRYFYDADAVREEGEGYGRSDWKAMQFKGGDITKNHGGKGTHGTGGGAATFEGGRNLRNVWTVATQPFSGAHFATFPPALIEPCIKAGSRPGDTVLDPFGGAGTTGLVADRLGRNAILTELNPEYAEMARARIHGEQPMFSDVRLEAAT